MAGVAPYARLGSLSINTHLCVLYVAWLGIVQQLLVSQATVDIGVRLKAWRVHLRRSQAEVERRAGLAHNAISRIETGDVVPRLATLERIAEALEVNVEQLQFRAPPSEIRREAASGSTGDVGTLLRAVEALPADRQPEIVNLLCQIVSQVNR
jgi:transcriptional regulator with XRE-family HTH domain